MPPVAIAPLDFTPVGLDALLYELDMKNSELAQLCNINVTTVLRWLKGETPIPHAVPRMLTMMLALRRLDALMQVTNAKAA